jgi:hypothetical protein
METKTDNSGEQYKVLNGTYYHIETPDDMVELLEYHRQAGTRLRFYFGDIKTGRDWGELNDIYGTIDRSTGPCKIPILLHNSRSIGGGAILTHCVVKLSTSKRKKLYQHPEYH